LYLCEAAVAGAGLVAVARGLFAEIRRLPHEAVRGAVPERRRAHLAALVRMLSSAFPKVKVDKLNIETLVSYMPVKDLYQNDPLVYHGNMPARLACELLTKISTVINESAPKISLPYLLFHGKSDQICAMIGSEKLFEVSKSTDKKFEKFEGMHELLNEGNPEALNCVVSWLKSRL